MDRTAVALVAILMTATLLVPTTGAASLDMTAPTGAVVFTFNEGLVSQLEAARLLEAHGHRGTFYVTSGELRTGSSNVGHLSAAEVADLARRGHDIASFGVRKVDLTTLSDAQLEAQLADSKAALESLSGQAVGDFAYPYGSADARVEAATARHYDTGRVVTTAVGEFTASVDSHRVPGLMLMKQTTLAKAKGYVDYAKANGVTVVFSLDRIVSNPARYDWTPQKLSSLLDHVDAQGVAVRTMDQLGSGSPPTPTAPAAPTLSATAGVGRVDLSWTTPANGGSPITGYKVWRGTSAGGETLLATLGATNGYADTNVTAGTRYYYQVTAVNAVGESARSNEASATPTSAPTRPGAPTLSASAGVGRVDLSWTLPPDGGSPITGYRLYRGTTSGGETLLATLGTARTYADTSVTAGVRYYYQVSAVNGVGEGPRSNEASATPTAGSSAGTVVFSFDDGYSNQVAAADVLAQQGFRGTFYVVTDWLGDGGIMTSAQAKALSDAGHDVESHTVTHPDLTTVSSTRLTSELRDSQATLQSLTGKSVRHLAYPYGAHNNAVHTATASYYTTGRIFLGGPSVSDLPTLLAQSGSDPYVVPGIGVLKSTSLATAKGYVDYAAANDATIVLTFHDIMDNGDTYSWSPANFAALVDYTKTKGVPVKTMAQAYP